MRTLLQNSPVTSDCASEMVVCFTHSQTICPAAPGVLSADVVEPIGGRTFAEVRCWEKPALVVASWWAPETPVHLSCQIERTVLLGLSLPERAGPGIRWGSAGGQICRSERP